MPAPFTLRNSARTVREEHVPRTYDGFLVFFPQSGRTGKEAAFLCPQYRTAASSPNFLFQHPPLPRSYVRPGTRETERREPSRSRDTSPRMGLLPPPRDSNSPRPPAFVSFEPPSRSVRALSNNSASASSASTTVGHRLPSPPVSPLSRPAILSRRTPQQQQPPCRWPPRQ